VVLRCGDLALRARMHPARAPEAGKPVRFSVAQDSCIVFPE